MILIYLNENKLATDDTRLECFLKTHKIQPPFAIAINRQLIPKQLYPETFLNDEDHIDIFVPMHGG